MTEWKEFFVVVFGNCIQIFIKPSLGETKNVLLAINSLSLRLSQGICEAHFRLHQDSLYDANNATSDSLYIFVRQNRCIISILELEYTELLGSLGNFSLLHHQDIKGGRKKEASEELYLPYAMTLGLTASAIAWCDAVEMESYEASCLMISRINWLIDESTGKVSPTFGKSVRLPKADMPFLHRFPCLDFDDGRGVLVVGTSIGELVLIRLKGSRFFIKGCLDDEIPIVHRLQIETGDQVHVSYKQLLSILLNVRRVY